MKFEELHVKYQNNTATPEEIAYVEAEIAKAKALAAIIDEHDARHAIAPTEDENVKKSVKSFLKKTRHRIALFVLAGFLLLSSLGVGGFFTAASIKATSNSSYNKQEAIELCKKWVADTHPTVKADEIFVTDCERELVLHHGFSRAYYEYEIEIVYENLEYEFWVNAKTGVSRVERD